MGYSNWISLQSTKDMQYLGIWIDLELNWIENIYIETSIRTKVIKIRK